MSADFTTVGLVASIKRRAFLPPGSGLTSVDLLQYATEELRSYIPAFLKGLREEYLVATLAVSITGAVNSLPERAVGAALRWLKWTCSDGTLRQIHRIEPERRQDFPATDTTPQVYYFEGNTVVLVPAVSSGVLVLGYQQRPGQLVLPSACGTITGIDTGTKTLTFASLPTAFTNSLLYDLVPGDAGVRPRTGGNFQALQLDAAVSSVTSTTMVFSASLPSGLLVGDYVCRAGETPIPQLPIEIHDLLAQATAAQIANSTGSARAGMISDKLTKLEKEMSIILSPRNDGSSRPIVSKSRIGYRRV